MSVAAMTMDDQRPLMGGYDKLPASSKYEQSLSLNSTSASASSGSGSGSGSSSSLGSGSGSGSGTTSSGNVTGVAGAGGAGGGSGVASHPGPLPAPPPSGPASPTPSGLEEHHHLHHHQHQQQHHQQQQQQQQQHQAQQQQQQNAVAEAVAAAEQRQRLLEDEIENLKLEQVRMGQQCSDALRREKILMRRLANKEQEFQDYVSQIAEYKAQQAPTALALRTALLDPAVNLLFERLKKELKATKAKLEETQNELSAWKFTPDSNTGKRLMAKCRLLYQENEELGKMTSNGRLAKLETELAMQKSFSEEVKKSQSELDDFLQELDEDVEGMQSTILFLQQELKTTRDRIQSLEKENAQLKQTPMPKDETHTPATNGSTVIGKTICKLETIDENSGLASNPTEPEVYNGSGPVILNNEQNASGEHLALTEDGSNGNGNAARLARKRNYEEEPTPAVIPNPIAYNSVEETAPLREVSAPRTLPPKKSKLRSLTRRSSQLEDELQAVTPVAVMPVIVDNAVAGMASEEAAAAVAVACGTDTVTPLAGAGTEASDAGAPGRILTRRRSVRMQQNGSGAVDYST